MLHRTKYLLAAFTLAGLALPALAEDTISPEADRVFWCASAFFWLAGDADDVGDAKEAEMYDGWAGQLTETGIKLLRAQNLSDPDRISQIIDAYDNTVLDELGTDKARYPVEGCQDLVTTG